MSAATGYDLATQEVKTEIVEDTVEVDTVMDELPTVNLETGDPTAAASTSCLPSPMLVTTKAKAASSDAAVQVPPFRPPTLVPKNENDVRHDLR